MSSSGRNEGVRNSISVFGIGLPPAPDGPAVQGGDRGKIQFVEQVWQGFVDPVIQGETEAFELCDVEIIGLCRLIEGKGNAKFAFVVAEGVGANNCAAKTKYACGAPWPKGLHLSCGPVT